MNNNIISPTNGQKQNNVNYKKSAQQIQANRQTGWLC